MNVHRANTEICSLQERLDQLHAKISHLDHQVSAYAAHHMRTYTLQGQEVTAEEIEAGAQASGGAPMDG